MAVLLQLGRCFEPSEREAEKKNPLPVGFRCDSGECMYRGTFVLVPNLRALGVPSSMGTEA